MRAAQAIDLFVRGLAAVLAASLVVAGFHDVSQGYDVWYYHLPFAARLAGVVDETTYAFSAVNAARYAGFPLALELLQGLVWRVTGHVEATSFVALAGLFALPLVLRRWFGVPPHVALLALLAIPLVQIHATAGYVDLPANACVTVLLLLAYRAIVTGEIGPRGLVAAAALAAAAANAKFQLVPIVCVTSLAVAVVALSRPHPKRRAKLALIVVALPLVFATPIKNAVLHGNPVWPVELQLAGKRLPHVEQAYAQSPPDLAASPRPLRFIHSIFELPNQSIASHARWSLDQWAPADDPSCRMGGYFGAYVALNLVALAAAVWRRRDREAWAALGVFGAVTVVAASVPQSHELRYYMHWMTTLVALNLVLWAKERSAVAMVAVGAFAIVAWSTGGGYLWASGIGIDELVARKTSPALLDHVAPGGTVCIAKPPWTFLYAPRFQPRARGDYRVQEAEDEQECGLTSTPTPGALAPARSRSPAPAPSAEPPLPDGAAGSEATPEPAR